MIIPTVALYGLRLCTATIAIARNTRLNITLKTNPLSAYKRTRTDRVCTRLIKSLLRRSANCGRNARRSSYPVRRLARSSFKNGHVHQPSRSVLLSSDFKSFRAVYSTDTFFLSLRTLRCLTQFLFFFLFSHSLY